MPESELCLLLKTVPAAWYSSATQDIKVGCLHQRAGCAGRLLQGVAA